jgi:hypothetical protein
MVTDPYRGRLRALAAHLLNPCTLAPTPRRPSSAAAAAAASGQRAIPMVTYHRVGGEIDPNVRLHAADLALDVEAILTPPCIFHQ